MDPNSGAAPAVPCLWNVRRDDYFFLSQSTPRQGLACPARSVLSESARAGQGTTQESVDDTPHLRSRRDRSGVIGGR
jgi:hypothetical protein